MAETPAETNARQLIRIGLCLLFDDEENDHGFDDCLTLCETELQAIYDGYTAEQAAEAREKAIISGTDAQADQ